MAAPKLCRVLLSTVAFFLFLFQGIEASGQACQNPVVRREWGSLNKTERRAYIDALWCMKRLPSQLPDGLVPGARNRHDDFVATHINLTTAIHLDGIFLGWHRNFVWLWETALHDECNYTGQIPFWDWPLWQSRGKLADSPLFDGSDTSVGSDGYPSDSYNCSEVGVWPNGTVICMPKANGGGCMMSGPFVNFTSNLGPFDYAELLTGNAPSNWTAYNPHCVSRDLNDEEAKYLSYEWYGWTLESTTIDEFQDRFSNTSNRNAGMHAVGHYVTGPAMVDIFSSPYDPAFFLHHGGVDRVWTQWQSVDTNRVYGDNAIGGTSTIFNGNSTPPVTFDTVLNWGYLGRNKTLGELMSVTAGDFCYTYEY